MRRRAVAQRTSEDLPPDDTLEREPRSGKRGLPAKVGSLGTPVLALALLAASSLVLLAARRLAWVTPEGPGGTIPAEPAATGRAAPPRWVTPEELAARVGDPPGSPVWLAFLGEVFDVTAGARHYGPGGGYHFFAGRDATRAFSTGDFTEEGLIANLNGLSDEEMLGLEHWSRFYRSGESGYAFVGYVAGGEFYRRPEVDGGAATRSADPGAAVPEPTPAKRAFEEATRRARTARANAEAREATFPACASRWSSARGGEVFCEDGRGRPRKEVTFSGGKRRVRCACFPDDSFSDARQLYPGCAKTATRCATG